MRIGIMATGALGGYYGARLAAAGHDVVFFARGAQLAALRDNGLKLESPLGDLHLPRVNASGDPASAGQMDIVLFAVKLWDTEKAARDMRPIVGATPASSRCRTASIQSTSCARCWERRTSSAAAPIWAAWSPHRAYRQTTTASHIVCGPPGGGRDEVVENFAAIAARAGVEVRISDDVTRDLWQKFVFLVALSGSTASTRQNLGPVLADADTRKLFVDLASEAVAVGCARGVALEADLAARTLEFASGFPRAIAHRR